MPLEGLKINFYMKTKFLLLAVLLFFGGVAFAMPEMVQEVDVQDPASLVVYLTPFIVLAATYLIRLVKPSIPGWATMLVVLAFSTLTSFLTDLLANPDIGFFAQLGLGLASVFVHQLQKQFSSDS